MDERQPDGHTTSPGEPEAGDPGTMRRTTEQHDELTEEASVAMRSERAYAPYVPPRQPAQDPPER